METLLDISTLSIEETTGRLLASVDDSEPKPNQDSRKLYLTKEQWLERYKSKEQESNRAGGGSVVQARRRTCRYCGILGYWAKECQNKKRDEQAQEHVAREGEDMLLLLESCVDGDLVTWQQSAADVIYLNEHKVFPVLDNTKVEHVRR